MSGPCACDYAFDRPSLTELKANGYEGVIRYLDWLPNSKVIDAAELAEIHAAGLAVGFVWEGGGQAATNTGLNGGVSDATEALRQANALGVPADRPIYFVLEDPNEQPQSDWPTIMAYAAGAASVVGVARTGGYGSQALIEHARSTGAISWGWQVGGWSPSVSAQCHLYQRLTPTIASPAVSGVIDEDAILQADWGGWLPGVVAPISTPVVPVSTPAAPPVSSPIPMEYLEMFFFRDNVSGATYTSNGVGKTYVPDSITYLAIQAKMGPPADVTADFLGRLNGAGPA